MWFSVFVEEGFFHALYELWGFPFSGMKSCGRVREKKKTQRRIIIVGGTKTHTVNNVKRIKLQLSFVSREEEK